MLHRSSNNYNPETSCTIDEKLAKIMKECGIVAHIRRISAGNYLIANQTVSFIEKSNILYAKLPTGLLAADKYLKPYCNDTKSAPNSVHNAFA